jgi:methionyl-tRNA formyltransferase
VARLAYLGSPPIAASVLRALHDAGHEIALVVTAADKRRGRGGALRPTAVKAAAVELGLRVSDRPADLVGAGAELGVVVAFGRIIKPDVLAAIPLVNLHFSLLPRWRGAAPVERAILAGDERTGVCLMQVEEGLDTGGVYARVETEIGPEETAADLRARLTALGTTLLVERLAGGLSTLGEPVPQAGDPTYAEKLTVDDLRLDFTLPACQLHRVVRVGRSWTTLHGGRRLIVHSARVDEEASGARDGHAPGTVLGGRVATGDGWLVPIEVQEEGRRRQLFEEWLRGARIADGGTLS